MKDGINEERAKIEKKYVLIDVLSCMGHLEGSIIGSQIIYCPNCSNIKQNKYIKYCGCPSHTKRLRAIFHNGDEPNNIPEKSKRYFNELNFVEVLNEK